MLEQTNSTVPVQAQRIMATAQRQRRPVLAPAADADAVDGRAAQWRPHVGEGEANPLSPAGRRDSIDSTDTVLGGLVGKSCYGL
jgi:hypothetical protein